MHRWKNNNSNKGWIIASAAISLSMVILSLAYVVSLNVSAKSLYAKSESGEESGYMSVSDKETSQSTSDVKGTGVSYRTEAKKKVKPVRTGQSGNTQSSSDNSESNSTDSTESGSTERGDTDSSENNNTANAEKGSIKEHRLSQNSRLVNYIWHSKEGEIQDAKVFIYEPEQFNGHTVCVDAGHGNNSHPTATQKKEKVYPVDDSKLSGMNTSMVGAKAYDYGVEVRASKNVYDNKEIEPEYTLKVALMVKDKLLAQGYRVVLTRNEVSQNLSNGARAVLAGETSDIMVSIHTNASGSKGASGTLTFYPGDVDYMDGATHPGYTQIMGIDKDVDKSKRLAELMAGNVSSAAGFTNKGAHSAILRIFSYSSIPVCLIEVGFSDQATDAKLLIEKKEQVANAIAKGIDEYFAR